MVIKARALSISVAMLLFDVPVSRWYSILRFKDRVRQIVSQGYDSASKECHAMPGK